MDLVDLARIVLKRWYVVLPVMVLAIVAAVVVAQSTEPVYEARGTFLMTDPPAADDTDEGTADANLLAEILNLDPRASGGVASTATTFEALAIDEDTVRVDAFAPSGADVLAVLAEQQTAAQEAAGGEEAIEVLAEPEQASQTASTDPDQGPVFQASMLLRVEEVEGGEGGPTVEPGYAGRILIELMNAPDATDEILDEAPDGDYSVDRDDSDQAPIFGIDVEQTSPEATLELFERVRSVAGDRLDTLQEAAGVNAPDRLELRPLAAPEPESVGGNELRRPIFLVIGLGILLSLGLAAVVEGVSRSRARRRDDQGFVATKRPTDERDPARLS